MVDSNEREHGVACIRKWHMNAAIPNVLENGRLRRCNALQMITTALLVYFIIATI